MILDARTQKTQPHSFTSKEARSGGFLRIPLAAIREIGQPAQTLAGLVYCLAQDGAATFRRLDLIARASGLKKRTVQTHLIKLETLGLIVKHGRQKRRTVSYGLSGGRDWFADGFLCLPAYATSLPWAQRLVLSWVLLRCENRDACQDSVSRMVSELGISRRAAQEAIKSLVEAGLIDREPGHSPGNTSTRLSAETSTEGAQILPQRGRRNCHRSEEDNLTRNKITTNEAFGSVGKIGAKDLDDLPALHARLVVTGAIEGSEHGTVCFFALAAHAMRLGKRPDAMLAWLLRRQLFHYATDADVDSGWQLRKQQRPEPRQGGLQGLATILETIRS
jgi:DNA-binding MarR family transcriptional regulator